MVLGVPLWLVPAVLGFGIVPQLVFPVCEATWHGEATAYSKALQQCGTMRTRRTLYMRLL